MAARKLLTPMLKAAAPRVAAHTRAMATKVEDVKLKDLPAYAQQVVNDPKTRSAYEVSTTLPHPVTHARASGCRTGAHAGQGPNGAELRAIVATRILRNFSIV